MKRSARCLRSAASRTRFQTSALTGAGNPGNLRALSAFQAGNQSWALIADDMPWLEEFQRSWL
ncbi:MAG: hypothetical protein CMJ75_12455 [Planctomycetaceae bacterium]|nr:hypothetical protein [Planctomycetaceae bacterium]